MAGISQILSDIYLNLGGLSLDVSLYVAWGAYAAVFLTALVLTLCREDARRADKRPFLSFTNAFTAVTLALMLTEKDVPLSILTAVVFWCIGYMLYGVIVLASKRGHARGELPSAAVAVSAAPPKERFAPSVPPAKGNVRLEHALSVTEKLLAKELGRGDRQEAERIKTVLTMLRLKPELSAEENTRLNEHFNTLLKLMAKYNV